MGEDRLKDLILRYKQMVYPKVSRHLVDESYGLIYDNFYDKSTSSYPVKRTKRSLKERGVSIEDFVMFAEEVFDKRFSRNATGEARARKLLISLKKNNTLSSSKKLALRSGVDESDIIILLRQIRKITHCNKRQALELFYDVVETGYKYSYFSKKIYDHHEKF